jgi:hypothetical protein
VLLLDRQILPMGIRGQVARQALDLGVHVEVKRHLLKLLSRRPSSPAGLLAEVDAIEMCGVGAAARDARARRGDSPTTVPSPHHRVKG